MIKPLQDYVVLVQEKAEKKAGSIILTTEKEKSNVGTIKAIGPGKLDEHGNLIKIDLSIGQKVLYKQYSTTEYKQDDTTYLLIKAEDIIAIVE